MSDQLIILVKKKTNIITQQTKQHSQEILKNKLNTSRPTFSFDTPLNLEEDKWLLGITVIELNNTV